MEHRGIEASKHRSKEASKRRSLHEASKHRRIEVSKYRSIGSSSRGRRNSGEARKSAAPCRRAKHWQQLRTISRGGLPPPPSSASLRHSTDLLHGSPMDRPWTARGLAGDSLWSHLGALLVVFSGSCSPSWASYVALGALLGSPNAPLSSNLHSDKPTWRQHWPQLASQAHFSIDRCPSGP